MLVTLRRDPILADCSIQGAVVSCPCTTNRRLWMGEGARILDEAGAGVVVPAQDADVLPKPVRLQYRMPKAEGGHGRQWTGVLSCQFRT
jgi:hypothetical protein